MPTPTLSGNNVRITGSPTGTLSDFGRQNSPHAATLSDGRVIFVWHDPDRLPGEYTYKIYSADLATVLVASTTVNPSSASGGSAVGPSTTDSVAVAGLAGGGFAIAWNYDGEVNYKVYNAAGQAITTVAAPTGVRIANTTTFGDQNDPDIVATPDGGFVVAWASGTRAFSATGVPQTTLETTIAGQDPALALGGAGAIYAVDEGLAIRVYTGGPSPINVAANLPFDDYSRSNPDLAVLGNGSFVAVFERNWVDAQSQLHYDVYASLNGAAAFRVNTSSFTTAIPIGAQPARLDPSVVALPQGGFLVVWHDAGSETVDGFGSDVLGQLYTSGGVPDGGEFVITNSQFSAEYRDLHSLEATVMADGRVLVTWSAGTLASVTDVYSQIVDPRPPQLADLRSDDDLTLFYAGTLTTNVVAYNIHNDGVAAAAASTSGLYLSTDSTVTTSDLLLATDAVPGIAAGGFRIEAVQYTLPGTVAPGTYYLGVVFDTGGTVNESNEANNASNVQQIRYYGELFTNGADTVTLPAAGETWYALNGDDSVTGTAGQDTVWGLGGNDTIRGGGDADSIFDNSGLNFLYGDGGVDTITGGADQDRLDGGTGDDVMTGGGSGDVYIVDSSYDQIVEDAGGDIDAVYTTATYAMADNVEHIYIQGTADLAVYGNASANLMFGNSGNNYFEGRGAADFMYGYGGDDNYVIDSSFDQIIEAAGEGIADTVYAAVNYAIGANIENLFLQGTAGIQGIGNAVANVIVGNTGDNYIDGGGGIDGMLGGLGGDTYLVDSNFDQIVENANEGTDIVYSAVDYHLGANLELLYLSGVAVQGFGNAVVNTIVGTSGTNAFDGRGGADVLTGNGGNDVFILRLGDGNGDTIMDFAGNGGAAGDTLQFFGLGTTGTSVTQINATVWQAAGSLGSLQFTLANGAALHTSDYVFLA